MKLTPEPFLIIRSRYLPLLYQLEALFGEMNKAYGAVAAQYRFQCNGCADNCCRTRFFHHTLLEYLYLVEGLRTLAPDFRQEIGKRALTVNAKMARADRRNESLHIMCPLNREERCLLYAYRPMICRLHGIPHELHRPNGSPIKHPGCDAFYGQCRQSGKTDYIRFDRTPFYRQMAVLESALRSATGYSDKIKLTIAQMLVTITKKAYEID